MSTHPNYLPAGSRLVATPSRTLSVPGRVLAGTQPAKASEYQLPGPANADTIPPGGVTSANYTAVHPGGYLTVVFSPELTELPQLPVASTLFRQTPLSVGGWSATLSVPLSGLGTYRVDWLDDAGYHAVIADRANNPEGLSGLDTDALTRVADSLYG